MAKVAGCCDDGFKVIERFTAFELSRVLTL